MFRFPPHTHPLLAAAAALLAVGRAIAADAKADAPAGETMAKKKVVFFAGGPSHGFGEHDHKSGCHLLAKRINEVPGFEATVYTRTGPRPRRSTAPAAVIMYCDGGNGHMAMPHLKELQALTTRASASAASTTRSSPATRREEPATAAPSSSSGSAGTSRPFYSINPTGQASSQASRSTRSPTASARSRPTTSGTTTCASATTWKA